MRREFPERRMIPLEPSKPVALCWYCNENVYPDEENRVYTIANRPVCERDECVEAIGLEIEADKRYKDLKDDYTFADFIRDEYGERKYIIILEDCQLLRDEEKMKERSHRK